MKKQTNKQRVIVALNNALAEIYHNATLYKWADDLPGCPSFYDWVCEAGSFEVEHWRGGGACGSLPYDQMQHIKEKAAAFKSEKARAYFLRMKRREYWRDQAEHIENRIAEYGIVYSYGRGGRTLCPAQWEAGGRSFRAKRFEFEDLTAERAAEMLRDVREFNALVRAWCDWAPAGYYEEMRERLAEEAAEQRAALHELNREALPLVREIKQAGRTFSPMVCKVLTDKLKDVLNSRKRALRDIAQAVETMAEAARLYERVSHA